MSYFSYPHGYLYPNEYYEPVLWLPVMVAYTLLISLASGSALLGFLGVLFQESWLERYRLPFLKLAAASSPVILLGPLADIRHPERGIYVLFFAHLFPSETHPGSSLIAILANLWLPLVLSVWGTLFFLNRNIRVSKVLSLVGVLLALVWAFYYAGLMITSDSNLFLYNLFPTLPVVFLIEAVLFGVALYLLFGRFEDTFTKLSAALVFAFLFLRVLESFRLFLFFEGSPLWSVLKEVYTGQNLLVLLLSALSFMLLLLSLKFSVLKVPAQVLTLLWVLFDRWNVVVNTQLISKTTMSSLDYAVSLSHWLPEAVALFLFFGGLYFLLSLKSFERKLMGGIENG